MRIRTLCLSPDAPPASPPLAPAPPAVSPVAQVNALTAQLIAQHGAVENALRHLVLQSATTDAAIQAHERTIADLKSKLPAEGSVVLPKAEAETFAKLKALGTPEEIQAKVKRAGELETTVAASTLEKLAKDAAAAAKLDPDAFAAHAAAKGLHIELRDTPVLEQGKTVTKKVPHVRAAADATAPLVALSEYAGKLPPYEQRALAAAPATPTGIEYPLQRPTPVTGATGDPTGDYIARRNAPKTAPAASGAAA